MAPLIHRHTRPALRLVIVSLIVPSLLGSLPAEDMLVLRHMSLELDVRYDSRTIAGTSVLTIENVGDTPAASVPLLLGRLLAASRVSDAAGDVGFAQDVVRFSDWPEYQVNSLSIQLREPLAPGDQATLSIEYDGSIVGYVETGMLYVRDRVDRDFTLIRSDALSFPVLGLPSVADMRGRAYEDFTFDAVVSVPDSTLTVAAAVPGTIAELPSGGRRWSFVSLDPVPFVFLSIAPYARIERGSASVFHFADDAAGAARLADAFETAVDAYTNWFGLHHEARPVTIMEIPGGWGSQASLTGGIIQTADAFRSGSGLGALFHEVAHLWHPRDLEQPADRWNEGFATFLQWRLLAREDSSVSLREAFERITGSAVGRVDDPTSVPPIAEYGETRSTDLAYRHGALFFYLLYESLGEDTFDRCVGRYIEEYRTVGSDNGALIESFEQCDPRAARVFDEWFTTTIGLARLTEGSTLDALIESYAR